MMMMILVATILVVVTVIVLHLVVFLYLRRLAWLKRSNICVKAPMLPIVLATGEVAKYFNRRPESEVSSYEAYNTLWFKDFAVDRHHVWLRVAGSAAIDDVIALSLTAIQRWSTQRGKIAIHSSMRRLHFGITIAHALGEVAPAMEEALYGALNRFDPGHLYRSISIRHPLRSANILSKKYTQQAYRQLQSLLTQYLKSSSSASSSSSLSSSPPSPSPSPSSPPLLQRSPVLTSLLEYHGDRESSSQVAEEKAIADVIAYLLGAISNVSSVLGWMVYDFVHHPEWRQRAQDEVKLLFPEGIRQLGDRDRLRQAKVLYKCINESIRLRDRFTTGIRRLTQDVTVPIPKSSSASSPPSTAYVMFNKMKHVMKTMLKQMVSSSSLPPPLSPSSSTSPSPSSPSSATSSTSMTFPKGSYLVLPYYYDAIEDASYDPSRQLPRSHFPMFGSGTHTCRGRDYAIAQITAIIAFLLLSDVSSDSTSSSSSSSSSKSSPSFRWGGVGAWVSSVPWSMASTAGVHSPPDDAPLYVEM